MLKTVTLEGEEIEILLSHHKQKLADLAREMQTLSEKQQFSETRLRELTDIYEHDETSIEDHLHDVVEVQDDGSLAVAASPEAQAVHEQEEEISNVAAEDTPEVVVEGTSEVVAEEIPEVVAEETADVVAEEIADVVAEETPDVAAEETPDVAAEESHDVVAEETSEVVAEKTHEVVAEEAHVVDSHAPEAVPHKGTFEVASE